MNEGHIIHVEPLNDLKAHSEDQNCACQPMFALAEDRISLIVIHTSYDGREHSEPDHNREQCEKCSQPHA
jgi:hypothetical protein